MGAVGAFFSAWFSAMVRKGRLFLGGVGAIVAVAGVWSMYSATVHSINGVNTSAALVDRFARCEAEFQPKGESRRREPMDCERAYAFREAVGSKKVRVHKSDYATVRYVLSDGTSRTATVYEGKVETRGLAIGTRFDAVYDPANPGDVRAQPSFSSVGFNLMMLAGGLAMIALALLPQLMGLFSWSDGKSAAAKPADVAAWGEDALKAIARHQPASQRPAAVIAGRGFGRGPSPADGPRRQFGVRGS